MMRQPSLRSPNLPFLAIPVLGTSDLLSFVFHELPMGVLAGAQGNPNRVMASGDEEQVPWAPETSLPAPPPPEALRRPSTGQLLLSV